MIIITQGNENDKILNVQVQEIRNIFSSSNDVICTEYHTGITNEKLRDIFTILDARINSLLEFMNYKNVTGQGSHYNDDPSRELLDLINILQVLQVQLKNSALSFGFDEYYEDILNRCAVFLKNIGAFL